MKKIVYLLLLPLVMLACENSKKNPDVHEVIVKEAVPSSNYIYLRVTENDKDYWIATTFFEPVIGKKYYYTSAMEMIDFKSKELNRTFKKIYFLDALSSEPIDLSKKLEKIHKEKKREIAREKLSIEAVEGYVTVADVYKNKALYAGKVIKMKAKIIKINADVLNLNWLHVQDGTSFNDNYSLTITTRDVVAKEGDIVEFEGKVSLDKDFGAGYTYKVIVEKAKPIN